MKFYFLIIALGWSSFIYGQKDWMPYRSPEGQFRILTQGIFKKSVTHAKTGIGKIDINTFVFPKEPKAEETIYMITFYDLPEGSIHSDSTQAVKTFFDETISAAVDNMAGQLLYQSDITVDGFYGRQWRINYNDGTKSIRTQAFLVENRYYILNVVNDNEKNVTTSVNHFFNSFRLL